MAHFPCPAKTAMTETREGGCLCGDVRFRTEGPLRQIIGCHCEQCRRTTGHFVAATALGRDGFTLTRADGLKHYRASETAQRGFCGRCGSSLFWEPDHGKHISIMAGAFDDTEGLVMGGHIFVSSRGRYYDVDVDLPCFDGLSDGRFPIPGA